MRKTMCIVILSIWPVHHALAGAMAPPPTEEQKKSQSYHTGYRDGCAHASTGQPRNGNAYETDVNYRQGWTSGYNNCRNIGPMNNIGRPADHLDNLF